MTKRDPLSRCPRALDAGVPSRLQRVEDEWTIPKKDLVHDYQTGRSPY